MIKSLIYSSVIQLLFLLHPISAGESLSKVQNPGSNIMWSVDYSPNGEYYAVGGTDRSLKIFRARDHALLKTYVRTSTIQSLDWDKSSKILAIGLDDKPVELLHIESGKFTKINGTTGSRAVAWNYTGELLAIGDYDGSLQIRSKTGGLIKTIKKTDNKTYLTVDWHPTRNIVLTGSDKLRIFDTSGKLLKVIKHRKEETAILTVKWHPSGNFFAVGDYGENENNIPSLLQYWREDGGLYKTMTGSKAEYRNVRWNRSGTLLATASDALRLWSIEGKVVFEGKSTELLWGIDWNRDETGILTTSNKNNIRAWSSDAFLMRTQLAPGTWLRYQASTIKDGC